MIKKPMKQALKLVYKYNFFNFFFASLNTILNGWYSLVPWLYNGTNFILILKYTLNIVFLSLLPRCNGWQCSNTHNKYICTVNFPLQLCRWTAETFSKTFHLPHCFFF